MNNDKILVTEIQIKNDNSAVIKYSQDLELCTNEIVSTGTEKVTEEFAKKFQEAVNSFVAITSELASGAEKLTMNIIRFQYKDKKIDKVSYSVKYKPQTTVNTNIFINNVPIYNENIGDNVFSVSGKDEKLLYQIIELAIAYMQGDTRTKQMKLEIV